MRHAYNVDNSYQTHLPNIFNFPGDTDAWLCLRASEFTVFHVQQYSSDFVCINHEDNFWM